MNLRRVAKTPVLLLVFSLILGLSSLEAQTVTVTLDAIASSKTLPDGSGLGTTVDVPMWGFRTSTTSPAVAGDWLPGPTINLSGTATTLHIIVNNMLPEATSVFIPGLPMPTATEFGAASAPIHDPDGGLRSLAHETAPMTPGHYWFDVTGREGTFLYQSGTNISTQVQMGLYGAVTKTAADDPLAPAGTPSPYYTGPASWNPALGDSDVVLLYSEIDAGFHAKVSDDSSVLATVDYQSDYFLINGGVFESTGAASGANPLADFGVPSGKRVLVRFLNAGLMSRHPNILGTHFEIIARDGYPLVGKDALGAATSRARTRHSLRLVAGRTIDVFLSPTATGDYRIFDRRGGLNNNGERPGGQITTLTVTPLL